MEEGKELLACMMSYLKSYKATLTEFALFGSKLLLYQCKQVKINNIIEILISAFS